MTETSKPFTVTEELRKIADAKGAVAYYQNRYASISYGDTVYLSGGKEDLSKVLNPDIPGSDAIQNSSYTFTDQSLIKTLKLILGLCPLLKHSPTLTESELQLMVEALF